MNEPEIVTALEALKARQDLLEDRVKNLEGQVQLQAHGMGTVAKSIPEIEGIEL